MKWNHHDVDFDETQFEETPISLDSLSIGKPLSKGSNGVVYAAKLKTQQNEEEKTIVAPKPLKRSESMVEHKVSKYPLAVKMMFNYDIQSNAMAILNAMYRETIPARCYYSNIEVSHWEIE